MTGSGQSVKQAVRTDLHGSIAIALDETFRAFDEALAGLSDRQLHAEPIAGKHSIAAIALHALENLDRYACRYQSGPSAERFDEQATSWFFTGPGETPPAVAELSGDRLRRLVRAVALAAEAALDRAEPGDLQGKRRCPPEWTDQGRNALDAYMRTLWHAMSHIRQIWALRGRLEAVDADHWPRQHWA